jgi:hypothetical protein
MIVGRGRSHWGGPSQSGHLTCCSSAMANGRCRMHGGTSIGPRSAAGLANLTKAHTIHGNHTAAACAKYRHEGIVIARNRILNAAFQLQAYLPCDTGVRMPQGSDGLAPPPYSNRSRLHRPAAIAPARCRQPGTLPAAPPDTIARDAHGRVASRPRLAFRAHHAQRPKESVPSPPPAIAARRYRPGRPPAAGPKPVPTATSGPRKPPESRIPESTP